MPGIASLARVVLTLGQWINPWDSRPGCISPRGITIPAVAPTGPFLGRMSNLLGQLSVKTHPLLI